GHPISQYPYCKIRTYGFSPSLLGSQEDILGVTGMKAKASIHTVLLKKDRLRRIEQYLKSEAFSSLGGLLEIESTKR
ncbi:MAG TPA: hypothetical protein VLL97_05550, partial [Acidobacteriota bacterium]|nr:hypothetical protein [Acidobacteriota bacterium]